MYFIFVFPSIVADSFTVSPSASYTCPLIVIVVYPSSAERYMFSFGEVIKIIGSSLDLADEVPLNTVSSKFVFLALTLYEYVNPFSIFWCCGVRNLIQSLNSVQLSPSSVEYSIIYSVPSALATESTSGFSFVSIVRLLVFPEFSEEIPGIAAYV